MNRMDYNCYFGKQHHPSKWHSYPRRGWMNGESMYLVLLLILSLTNVGVGEEKVVRVDPLGKNIFLFKNRLRIFQGLKQFFEIHRKIFFSLIFVEKIVIFYYIEQHQKLLYYLHSMSAEKYLKHSFWGFSFDLVASIASIRG